ncbi:hypothetical protein ALC62_09390 [Cyphomyrmex costatus]|uniref:Uncharacterized protein n=1 Tax=Cyphomyrmex costatus TaxID=456900 RepID=A0A195CGC8_9HYME|nr:hypothetical protein ALC62_09390 [Cyphomyrmex costatus]
MATTRKDRARIDAHAARGRVRENILPRKSSRLRRVSAFGRTNWTKTRRFFVTLDVLRGIDMALSQICTFQLTQHPLTQIDTIHDDAAECNAAVSLLRSFEVPARSHGAYIHRVGSTSTSAAGGGGGVAGTKKKGEKKGHKGWARREAEETGLREKGGGTRPLWRGGVAAQTLAKKNRRGKCAQQRRAKRVILRRGAADRATLSRENHPLFFFPSHSFPVSRRYAIDVLCPTLAFGTFRALPFPFRHGNHPFGAPHESSPPRCRLEYRNRSVGAKGHGGKRGLVRNTGGGEGCAGNGGVTVAGLVVEVRRASSIKIIFQRALPPARYHPEISAL